MKGACPGRLAGKSLAFCSNNPILPPPPIPSTLHVHALAEIQLDFVAGPLDEAALFPHLARLDFHHGWDVVLAYAVDIESLAALVQSSDRVEPLKINAFLNMDTGDGEPSRDEELEPALEALQGRCMACIEEGAAAKFVMKAVLVGLELG